LLFIFVIDSMRPDYLGAYNPGQVHYTPNLDALARERHRIPECLHPICWDSISEPAIWAGAELLHTHFPQPFDEVNSLRTLSRIDGYQLMASYHTVLRQLSRLLTISPSSTSTSSCGISMKPAQPWSNLSRRSVPAPTKHGPSCFTHNR
jgi:hypothetical protein